MTILAK